MNGEGIDYSTCVNMLSMRDMSLTKVNYTTGTFDYRMKNRISPCCPSIIGRLFHCITPPLIS